MKAKTKDELRDLVGKRTAQRDALQATLDALIPQLRESQARVIELEGKLETPQVIFDRALAMHNVRVQVARALGLSITEVSSTPRRRRHEDSP